MTVEPPAGSGHPDAVPDLGVLATEITADVGRILPEFLATRARARLGADDHLPSRVSDAIAAGTARAVAELAALFDQPVREQRRTPLEIIRGAGVELTAVLTEFGAEPAPRDHFHVRGWPEDVFGLVPDSPQDLGSEDLAVRLFAWGVVKARSLRAEATNP